MLKRKRILVVFLVANLIGSPLLAESVNAAEILATGSYSENANSDGAPISSVTKAGNIKTVQVQQTDDGKLKLTIDYWGKPNSHYVLRIQWCTYLDEYRHNAWTGEDLTLLCDVMDPNWKNYVVWFEPALASKGNQSGLRKSFKGTIKKGTKKYQWIYTLSGELFRSTRVAGVDISTYYVSDAIEKVTTTCRGVYSITCNTSTSNVFDVDEVLIETT